MLTSEAFRVLLFLAAVLIVYVRTGRIVLTWILERLRGSSSPSRPGRAWLDRAVLGLAVVGILCTLYGVCVEPYWLSVIHVKLATEKLPKGSTLRVVLISDLHSDPKVRLEERLPGIIAAQSPDVIVFTGDTINSPGGLPVFRRCLSRIAAVAPTFVVQGNWDAWYWQHLHVFDGTGVRELNGEATSLSVRGSVIGIAGVAVGNELATDRALLQVPRGVFTLFLYHYPDLISEASRKGVDLYCAGHTHGGQVALPWYGALVTLSRYGKRYESGLYRVGATWLYVNRGIGMEGGSPRVRFWAWPEVTVIDLESAAAPHEMGVR